MCCLLRTIKNSYLSGGTRYSVSSSFVKQSHINADHVVDLYTAGTVILAVLLTPTLRLAQHHNLASLEMSFAMCINSLSFFAEADGGFAKSCLLILHRAYNHETRPETQSSYEGELILPRF